MRQVGDILLVLNFTSSEDATSESHAMIWPWSVHENLQGYSPNEYDRPRVACRRKNKASVREMPLLMSVVFLGRRLY